MAFSGLLLPACKKAGVDLSQTIQDSAIDSARSYFSGYQSAHQSSFDMHDPRTIDWNQATSYDSGTVVIAPVNFAYDDIVTIDSTSRRFFNRSGLTRLKLIRNDKSPGYTAVVETMMPDDQFLQKPTGRFTGLIFQQEWQGNALGAVRFGHANTTAFASLTQLCITMSGKNYTQGHEDKAYYWSSTTCYVIDGGDYGGADGGSGTGTGGSGSGTGGSGSGGTLNSLRRVYITAPPPTSKINDLKSYLKCFTASNTATYNVQVCVDQPVPGSRAAWGMSIAAQALGGENPVDVGHTFLVLTETDGNTTITRNIGFYPEHIVNPLSTTAKGVYNDDGMHHYNVSAGFSITPSNFMNLVSYINGTASATYDLNDFNCTTWAIDALDAGHIYLPSTIGSWPGGMGNDPGDFGVDIMNSNAPGITKSQSEQVHVNAGSCD